MINFAKIREIFRIKYSDEQILEVIGGLNISTLTVNTLGPLFIFFVLFNTINTTFLIFWLVLQLSIVFVRKYVGDLIGKDYESATKDDIDDVFKYYLWVVGISGMLWGVLSFYTILNTDIIYTFFMITLIFSLSAGSILTLGPIFIAVFAFNVFMVIPTLVALFFKADILLIALEIFLLGAFFVVTLITSYKKHLLSRENQKNLLFMKQYENITNLSGIVSKSDINGRITFANENFCQISGYKEEELLGQPHSIIRHPDMPSITFKDMWHTIKEEKKSWSGIIKNRAKNGESYYVSSTISPVLDRDGNVIEFIALRHDISSIMSDKKQLFDYLGANKLSVLIMIQIEDYPVLEKLYDKATVEKIEKVFGDAILYLLPNECDFQRVYYLENGLFAIAKNRRTCRKSQGELEEMLQEFLLNVKEYIVRFEKIEYDISAICSYTYGVIQTYEDAKIGIEKAIENNLNIIYADGLSGIEYAIALSNIETLHTLKVALDDQKVISFFQPIINNQTRKVEKYESLVRLINKEGQIISPYHFLDVAKKGRYYTQITRIVLENSFKTLRATDKEISVNLSTLDIENDDIKEMIFELLAQNRDVADRLIFELLESEDVKDFKTVVAFVQKVKPYGVKIAIDDFGSGYSNFERLLQYEPDILKIDGSLIKYIEENQLSKNIVETIVLFAKKQRLKTVAEFVETEEIFNIVKEMGIDFSQGYAFGKPEDLLKEL